MKIGVISDIHSNIIAFETVLKELENQGINKFIIAGDHICDGPSPVEVIKKIKTLDAYCIKGNRENYILEMYHGNIKKWKDYKQVKAIVWTYDALDNLSLEWIDSLKEKSFFDIYGHKIKVVHGSPRDVYEHIYPKDEDKLNTFTNELDASVLICGHTHYAFVKEVNDVLVMNPGSCGLSLKGSFIAEYGIIEFKDEKWSGELRRTYYDGNLLKEDFLKKDLFNEVGLWSKLIYKSQSDARNYNREFVLRAKELEDNENDFISNKSWEFVENEYKDY